MSVIAKVGERTYVFKDKRTLYRVERIYASFIGDQNQFEEKMEDLGIEYDYDYDGGEL